jgi:hypothetical protein
MNAERLEELLLAYEEGELTEHDRAELKTLLVDSPVARRRLVECQVTLQSIREHEFPTLRLPYVSVVPSSKRPLRSMIASAAAGLVIGCFSTGMLWALSKPTWTDGLRRVVIPLANPGFERMEVLPQIHLVPVAEQWSGLDTEIVTGGGSRPLARGGQQMIRLGPAPVGKGFFANVMADLSASRPATPHPLQIEVTAHYHASKPGQGEHYSLSVATFAEDAPTVSGHWENTWRDMRDASLTTTGRAIFPSAAEQGWQTITVRLEVPPQARTLVISMGSNTPGPVDGRTDHFMDDVEATWIISEANPQP